MNVLGLRCSNAEFTFAAMSGTKLSPILLTVGALPYPKNFARPRCMLWFAQELEQIIRTHAIQTIVIKRSEGRTKSGAFEQRAEYEGVAYLAAGSCGLTAISKKVNSTIAKDLGLKGRAHYLETFNTSPVPNFDDRTDKEQEAILCAWSELG